MVSEEDIEWREEEGQDKDENGEWKSSYSIKWVAIPKEEKEERTFTRDEYENKAKKIIGRLNAYCLKQDGRRLGLPVLDEVAMAEMSDIVCKILKQ